MKRAPNYRPELGKTGVMAACIQLLDVYHIRYWRMNAGDRMVEAKGKRYKIKGHPAGTPDLLLSIARMTVEEGKSSSTIVISLAPPTKYTRHPAHIVWVECKSTNGTQSAEQTQFQSDAERGMETYLLVNDVKQLEDKLRYFGVIR